MDRENIELTKETVKVERRPRSGIVISVRLSPAEADQLQEMAEARGLTISQIARKAVSSYLKGQYGQTPPVWPFMGTTTGGAHFELSYKEFGSTIETIGVAQEPQPVRNKAER